MGQPSETADRKAEAGRHSDLLLTAATYNIHRCIGKDGKYMPQRIAKVICELEAEVIALQEVDTEMPSLDGMDQIRYLADSTGMHLTPGPAIWNKKGYYGNALLSRHLPLQVRQLDLSVKNREPRSAVEITVPIKRRNIRIIGTHLGLHRKERYLQAEKLLQFIGSEKGLMVLLGDFNEWMYRSRAAMKLEKFLGKSKKVRTYPTWLPILSIDRVWVLPQTAKLELQTHRTGPAKTASDHLPVKAKIAWRNEE